MGCWALDTSGRLVFFPWDEPEELDVVADSPAEALGSHVALAIGSRRYPPMFCVPAAASAGFRRLRVARHRSACARSPMFNIVAAELIFAAIFLAIVIVTWPTPPWDKLLYGGVALMVIIPALLYPFSKTLFLAFDMTFRPPTPEDFE